MNSRMLPVAPLLDEPVARVRLPELPALWALPDRMTTLPEPETVETPDTTSTTPPGEPMADVVPA